LFGAVITLARRLPALPAFWPPPYVQPVHVDDLVEALLTVAIRTDLAGAVLSIGAASPVSFTDFLRALARSRLRKRRAFIPTPRFAIGAARLFVGSTISSRLGLDRLESLFTLPMMDTAKDLRRLGLTLRPLETGLARGANGVRRARIAEGRAMLAYVLRAPPRSALVRRYVRAIERLRGGAPLPLPDLALRRPACLALFDGAGATRGELGWRLDAAVALAEASPQGAKRFLRSGLPSGFLKAALALSLAAFCELTWRGAALLSWPLLRRWKACR
jgi:NADH dehydrogenase